MARKTNGGPKAPFSASSASASKSKSKVKPSRANRASKNDPANAYTYEPSLPKRHRTSEQQLSLSRDEAKAGPSSPRNRKNKKLQSGNDDDEEEGDEEEEMEERIRKLQMMIASETPGEVDEDSEESEVDSDEAWESDGSDEERWGDVFRDLAKGKSKAKKAKGKEVVLKVCSIHIFRSRG
jgi:U3 small nucleolar RNA-associated protein 14